MRWEEGKKWQARMEKIRNLLKDKEKETESLSKQLATMKELYGRSDTTLPQHIVITRGSISHPLNLLSDPVQAGARETEPAEEAEESSCNSGSGGGHTGHPRG